MSEIVAAPAKSEYVVKRAQKLDKAINRLEPLTVHGTEISLPNQTKTGLMKSHSKDVMPVAGMFMVTMPFIPALTYSTAPDLYYTVPGMAGMALATLGWLFLLGTELSRNIDRTEKAITKRYAPEVESWLTVYGSFNAKDIETITNIVLYESFTFSGACFISHEGSEFMLIWDKETRSWFMEELAEAEEQISLGSAENKSLASASTVSSSASDEVVRKINMLNKQQLSVEDYHRVNRVHDDLTAVLLSATELKELGENDYLDYLTSTVQLLENELDDIIRERKNGIRDQIATLRRVPNSQEG